MKWLLACAAYNLAFEVFHLTFWRVLRWPHELAKLNATNRAVMQILNLRLTYVFVLVAVLSVIIARTGQVGILPLALMSGMALFWAMRCVEQLWFFGVGKTYSKVLTAIFGIGACIHAFAALAVR